MVQQQRRWPYTYGGGRLWRTTGAPPAFSQALALAPALAHGSSGSRSGSGSRLLRLRLRLRLPLRLWVLELAAAEEMPAIAATRRGARCGAPPPWQAGVISRRVRAAKYDGWRGLSGAHGAPHRWRYYYYCRLTAYEGISRDGTPPLVATGVRSPCGGNGAAFCAPATQSIGLGLVAAELAPGGAGSARAARQAAHGGGGEGSGPDSR